MKQIHGHERKEIASLVSDSGSLRQSPGCLESMAERIHNEDIGSSDAGLVHGHPTSERIERCAFSQNYPV